MKRGLKNRADRHGTSREASTRTGSEAGEAGGVLPRVLLGAALALAALVHIHALWFPFVDDDLPQIVQNTALQSWKFFWGYFCSGVSGSVCGTNYYRPVFSTWMLLTHTVFGLDPMAWHAVVLLLHVLVTGGIYLLAARLVGDKIAAGYAALIFAVHPVAVESVVWVSGVSEPLMALFFVGALLCYRRWRQTGSRPWYWVSPVLFAISLFAKETAVILPALILMWEWKLRRAGGMSPAAAPAKERGGRWNWPAMRATLAAAAPYLWITAGYLVARSLSLRGLAPMRGNVANWTTVIFTWPEALCFYLQKLVFPWPLSLFYRVLFVVNPGLDNFLWPLAVVTAVAAGLWVWSKRAQSTAGGLPGVGATVALMFVPLAPVLLAMVRFDAGQLVHDRYLYLPMIGFAMLCGRALRNIRWSGRKLWGAPAVQLGVAVAILGALATASVVQTEVWSSNHALYAHCMSVVPDSAPANVGWANLLMSEKRPQEAYTYFTHAVELDPDDARTNYSFGETYLSFGQVNFAEKYLRKANDLKPNEPCFCYALGLVLGVEGRLPEAEAAYHCAEGMKAPGRVYVGLGLVLEKEGRLQEARAEFQKALDIEPETGAAAQIQRIDQKLKANQSK